MSTVIKLFSLGVFFLIISTLGNILVVNDPKNDVEYYSSMILYLALIELLLVIILKNIVSKESMTVKVMAAIVVASVSMLMYALDLLNRTIFTFVVYKGEQGHRVFSLEDMAVLLLVGSVFSCIFLCAFCRNQKESCQ